MNLVPSIAPVLESLTMVLRVLELLPPLTAMTSAKVLLGKNLTGAGTGVSGMRRVVVSPLLGSGRRTAAGTGVPSGGSGVTVSALTLAAGVSPGAGVSAGGGAKIWSSLSRTGVSTLAGAAVPGPLSREPLLDGSWTVQAPNKKRPATSSSAALQFLRGNILLEAKLGAMMPRRSRGRSYSPGGRGR